MGGARSLSIVFMNNVLHIHFEFVVFVLHAVLRFSLLIKWGLHFIGRKNLMKWKGNVVQSQKEIPQFIEMSKF